MVIVHGGGAALSRTLKQLGLRDHFVNGLRVTDSQTRDVAIMVLAGQLNKQLVAAIGAAGQPAIGLCGGDLRMFRAVEEAAARPGLCGRDSFRDPEWIERLWAAGIVPVISSLALGFDGEYYNVNADQMASACAIACGAHALIYLTDVAGVKDADGAVIRWLDVKRDCADGRAGHGKRRHAAQAGSLHQRSEEGRDAGADSAGVERRGSARIFYPPHRGRHGGHCVMMHLAFDRALERRKKATSRICN